MRGYILAIAVFILWLSFVGINKNLHKLTFGQYVREMLWLMIAVFLTAVIAQRVFDAQVRR